MLLLCVAGCSSSESPLTAAESPERAHGTLTREEVAKALAVARGLVEDQGASVSNASAIARPGTLEELNNGDPCRSGRVLKIRLVGTFPRTVTSGHVVTAGDPAPDFTVRAVDLTVDAESGRTCLIVVRTDECGEVKPLRDATTLTLGRFVIPG